MAEATARERAVVIFCSQQVTGLSIHLPSTLIALSLLFHPFASSTRKKGGGRRETACARGVAGGKVGRRRREQNL